MTELKDKKKPIVLLVLTLICTVIGIVSLVYYADLFSNGDEKFSTVFLCILDLFSFIILFLYLLKNSFQNKFILICFLAVRILSSILTWIGYSLEIRFSLEAVILCTLGSFILPHVFVFLNLIKNKKIIEYITLSSLIINTTYNILVFIMIFTSSHTAFDLLFVVGVMIFSFLLFCLWYTQIAQHIGFKHKIKFDYKPIQKKLTVSEVSLEELKLMYDNGTISDEEYNRRKSEIINKL